jgi:hypothetical protein
MNDERRMPTEPDELALDELALDEVEFVHLEELVSGLVVDDARQVDEVVGLAVTLEELRTEFPIELQIAAGDAGVSLAVAPPTQHVETSILPVWHQLRVTVVRHEEQEDAIDDGSR